MVSLKLKITRVYMHNSTRAQNLGWAYVYCKITFWTTEYYFLSTLFWTWIWFMKNDFLESMD